VEPVIRGNVISRNRAAEGGAISLLNFSIAEIIQNLIAENFAFTRGGGIIWLVPSGSGIRGPRLVNNTIVNNDSNQGSGVFADGFDSQVELVNNVIVALPGQTALFAGSFDASTPITRFNNVFSLGGAAYGGIWPDATGSNGNISVDPQFVNPALGDYHLQPGSPAIDAGDNQSAALLTTDIDGNDRVLDGNRDGVAVVDMGIDEFVPPPPPPPTFDFCIQDNTNGKLLQFNSMTGAYRFSDCSKGFVLTGQGQISINSCKLSMTDSGSDPKHPDRRLMVSVNLCTNAGSVSLQLFAQGVTHTLFDSNIRDNTCACR
jgi:hypothetical protein